LQATAPFKEASDLIRDAGGESFKLCFQCGMCTASCPWNAVRSYTPHRLITEARFGLADLEDEGWWLCTTCRLCVSRCPRGVGITDIIRAVRTILLEYQYSAVPESLRSAMGHLGAKGNPWGGEPEKRASWTHGLDVEVSWEASDMIYFPCCTPAYDPELQGMAQSTVKILQKAGLRPGILGHREVCCGESTLKAGNRELFETLARANLETFRETGTSRVVVSSPHCLNTFRTDYPALGGTFQTLHVTEVLAELLDQGRLAFQNPLGLRVVYHDPCYLGRYSGIYEAPRRVLEGIPGIERLDEIDTRENSLCCGGGGGRIWMETKKGERFSDILVDQALTQGADVLATACPYCILNFRDSVRTLEAEDRIRIMDVAELVWKAL
jgi:Fe-S oxidoreductase